MGEKIIPLESLYATRNYIPREEYEGINLDNIEKKILFVIEDKTTDSYFLISNHPLARKLYELGIKEVRAEIKTINSVKESVELCLENNGAKISDLRIID